MKLSFVTACAALALSVSLLGCSSTGTETAAVTPSTAPQGAGITAMPADLEAALRQAQAQRRSGDFEGATHTLSQLVLVAPDDPRALGEYGKTLVAQGRSDDAIAFLQRAIQLQPSEWSYYSAVGVAYDQKGDFRSAQTAYARALSLKPGEPSVLSNAALSRLQQGDIAGAHTLLAQAAKSHGADPKVASNLAFVESIQASAPAVAAAHPPAPKPAATASAAPAHPAAAPARTAAAAAPKPAAQPVATHAPAALPAKPERTAAVTPPTTLRHSE